MTAKDWTLTDQADAADAGRDRNWWRRTVTFEKIAPDQQALSGGRASSPGANPNIPEESE